MTQNNSVAEKLFAIAIILREEGVETAGNFLTEVTTTISLRAYRILK